MTELEVGFKIGTFFAKTQASFKYGPNPLHEQTERGIVLEMRGETLRRIHTPLGFWNVGARVDWDTFPGEMVEIFEKDVTRSTQDIAGRLFGLVAWEGVRFEKPVYRDPEHYWSKEKVKEMWAEFIKFKQNFSFFPLM